MINVINIKEGVSNGVTYYYVGRGNGSIVGNPFTHHKDKKTLAECIVNSVSEAIEKYEVWLHNNYENNIEVKNFIDEIKIKSLTEDVYLGCWCYPNPCHGTVIKNFIQELIMKEQFNLFLNDTTNNK